MIDGVIQSESAPLSDVRALDIDHVEIMKGAAAASVLRIMRAERRDRDYDEARHEHAKQHFDIA